MVRGALGEWEGDSTGGNLCVHVADSLHRTAETNTF